MKLIPQGCEEVIPKATGSHLEALGKAAENQEAAKEERPQLMDPPKPVMTTPEAEGTPRGVQGMSSSK